jgi:hypothetical protein
VHDDESVSSKKAIPNISHNMAPSRFNKSLSISPIMRPKQFEDTGLIEAFN